MKSAFALALLALLAFSGVSADASKQKALAGAHRMFTLHDGYCLQKAMHGESELAEKCFAARYVVVDGFLKDKGDDLSYADKPIKELENELKLYEFALVESEDKLEKLSSTDHVKIVDIRERRRSEGNYPLGKKVTNEQGYLVYPFKGEKGSFGKNILRGVEDILSAVGQVFSSK